MLNVCHGVDRLVERELRSSISIDEEPFPKLPAANRAGL
jgi:hypothetical protein